MTSAEYISNLKIKIYSGNLTRCPDSWCGNNVSSAFHKLYFPIEGSAYITAKGQTFRISKGEMMLIPKGVRHSFRMTEERSLTKYWLHFTALSDGADLFENYKEIVVWDFSAEEVLREAVKECDGIFYPPGNSELAKALNRQAALYALFGLIMDKEKTSEKLSFSAGRPAALAEYIEEHLSEEIRVEKLARIAYMHPTAFIRYFKSHFGMPPLKYVKCLRLERAKYYLESTELPLSEIAEKTGFRDPSHFGREFKLTYGFTPGEARRIGKGR